MASRLPFSEKANPPERFNAGIGPAISHGAYMPKFKKLLVWLLVGFLLYGVTRSARHFTPEQREDISDLFFALLTVAAVFAFWVLDMILTGYIGIRKLRKAVFSGQIGAERALAFKLSPSVEGLFWLRLCAERGDMEAMNRLSTDLTHLYHRSSVGKSAQEAVFWALLLRRLIALRDLSPSQLAFHSHADDILNFGRRVLSQDALSCLESDVESIMQSNTIRFVAPSRLCARSSG